MNKIIELLKRLVTKLEKRKFNKLNDDEKLKFCANYILDALSHDVDKEYCIAIDIYHHINTSGDKYIQYMNLNGDNTNIKI